MSYQKPPTSELGRKIFEGRESEGATQESFGRRYSVSGPAIFKFEKGKVMPSFSLWMKMAVDLEISERHATLLWVKEKMPPEYRHYLDIPAMLRLAEEETKDKKAISYRTLKNRSKLRKATLKDKFLPKGLKDLLADDDIWALFKPTGEEIDFLKYNFSSFGYGAMEDYREALRLVRRFAGSR